VKMATSVEKKRKPVFVYRLERDSHPEEDERYIGDSHIVFDVTKDIEEQIENMLETDEECWEIYTITQSHKQFGLLKNLGLKFNREAYKQAYLSMLELIENGKYDFDITVDVLVPDENNPKGKYAKALKVRFVCVAVFLRPNQLWFGIDEYKA